MIEISNLSVSVKDRVLLNGISAVMEEGKIYAFLGENGSGKSTFIRALTSYFPDYSGSIAFDGRELKTFRQKEREKLHSLLPQMLPHFDISVSSFLSMYPDGKKELSKLGLGYLLEERMNTLSGGEKEMVFLAFALSRSAQLYAFDEPEAGLDAMYKEKTENAVRRLAEGGKTVLVSFHDIGRALRIADGFMILSHGELVFSGNREELLDDNAIERIFGLKRALFTDENGEKHILFI